MALFKQAHELILAGQMCVVTLLTLPSNDVAAEGGERRGLEEVKKEEKSGSFFLVISFLLCKRFDLTIFHRNFNESFFLFRKSKGLDLIHCLTHL